MKLIQILSAISAITSIIQICIEPSDWTNYLFFAISIGFFMGLSIRNKFFHNKWF